MAQVRISDLPRAVTLNGTDLVAIVQNGITKAAAASLFEAGGSGTIVVNGIAGVDQLTFNNAQFTVTHSGPDSVSINLNNTGTTEVLVNGQVVSDPNFVNTSQINLSVSGSNVSLSLAQNGANIGQVLTWDGSAWVPGTPSAAGVSSVRSGTGIAVDNTTPSSPIINIQNTTVTAGVYTNPASITVNAQGQITSITGTPPPAIPFSISYTANWQNGGNTIPYWQAATPISLVFSNEVGTITGTNTISITTIGTVVGTYNVTEGTLSYLSAPLNPKLYNITGTVNGVGPGATGTAASVNVSTTVFRSYPLFAITLIASTPITSNSISTNNAINPNVTFAPGATVLTTDTTTTNALWILTPDNVPGVRSFAFVSAFGNIPITPDASVTGLFPISPIQTYTAYKFTGSQAGGTIVVN